MTVDVSSFVGNFAGDYQVWCDVGGTFTDCIVKFSEVTKSCLKVPSSGTVTYTHMTLPTNREVFNAMVATYPKQKL